MQTFTTNDWRFGFQHSRLILLVWSPRAAHAKTQREKLAYAMQLGKPIRLVLFPGVRLPEDVCVGYADFQVAGVPRDPEALQPVLERWLAEVKDRINQGDRDVC